MTESSPQASTATVETTRGARYGKQLAAHLGRRLRTQWDDAAGSGSVTFDDGRCEIEATPDRLLLHAETDGSAAEGLEHVEDVVGRHLVRFGTRDELVVRWVRPDGSQGRTFRHTDDRPEGHTMPG